MAAAAGDRFVLRDTSSSRTVGGGTFIDLRAPSARRRTPERFAMLEALAEKDPVAALTRILDRQNGWIDLGVFLRDRAIGEEGAAAIVVEAGSCLSAAARGRCRDARPEVGRVSLGGS